MVLNNWLPADIIYINDFFPAIFKLFIANKEVGDSGTPHLQAYGELIHPCTIKSLKKKLKSIGQPRWHVELAKGSLKQNLQYIRKTKHELDIQIGTFKDTHQSNRVPNQNKLLPVIDMIKSGSNIHEIAQTNPEIYVRSSTDNRLLAMGRDWPGQKQMGIPTFPIRILQRPRDRLVGRLLWPGDSYNRRFQTIKNSELCEDIETCGQISTSGSGEMRICSVCCQTSHFYLPYVPVGYFLEMRLVKGRGVEPVTTTNSTSAPFLSREPVSFDNTEGFGGDLGSSDSELSISDEELSWFSELLDFCR